ncbi:acyl-CoA dehydrogenase family protein [Galactobacter caseinivorans]|uniref:acyl-CoA oxidase n=1 Tax=Galactobacter caseinivorans TaxID=2676123 RepID=A0A496PKP0_9MICC|nr:acyl-CoA dehydrogenase [Galactobacter caseinivorans]RKW71093.1 acyl-CoA dehydrogenase [Galactobacter caseinivorans]
MTSTTPTSASASKTTEDPRLDVAAVGEQLMGRWADARRVSRELATNPQLHKVEGMPVPEHRERTFQNMFELVKTGAVHRAFPSRLGGSDDNGGNIAAFEELVTADPSLQIKAGVQWGLFGSAVLHLGTKEHQDTLLPGIMDLSVPGAFAMTETGHGSDVASIGTTATYDPSTQEFVINTPFRAAWKDYLGNAALHATAATVFAQLITNGVNHGVHCFYVPIRDENRAFLPGIGGEDDGVKGGLNGIDNGRLHFDHVRIPRTSLLNRYGNVDEDGTYTSSIESPGRRFFTMLGTLVQGRVSLDGAAVAASKVALQIAVTYANQRRQFNAASDIEEEVIMDYQRHQRRLIPRIARTYAGAFSHEELLVAFDGVFSGEKDTEEGRQDLETLAAALKPTTTWDAMSTLQEAREACGGAGYLAENRFTGLHSDLDVYTTFEGDNNILLQLVGKRLLTDFSAQFKGAKPADLARYALRTGAEQILARTGLRALGQDAADTGSEKRTANYLKDPEVQRALLTERVEVAIGEIGRALASVAKASPAEQAAAFNSHQEELIQAAHMHARLLQWEAFTRGLESVKDADSLKVLTWVRDLFALTTIEDELDWFLMNGRLSVQRARTLKEYVNRLITRLRPHAQDLVDAFGYTQAHLRAPISSGAEQIRQDEAAEYYRHLRADPESPVDERVLVKRRRAEAKAARR